MTAPELKHLLTMMWLRYLTIAPQAARIHWLLSSHNRYLSNDHIALRTFNLPRVNVNRLASPFLSAGYSWGDHYAYPQQHLTARYLLPPQLGLPKIFISQLELQFLSEPLQSLIHNLVVQIPEHAERENNFCCSGRQWQLNFQQYRQLTQESRYAAWLAAFGFIPSHYALSTNSLKSHRTLPELIQFLTALGIDMNQHGGVIKGSRATLLEYSSTQTQDVDVSFDDGKHSIPGSHYEFAHRYPQRDGQLYNGFIAAPTDLSTENETIIS